MSTEFPVLRTERLVLRPIAADDLAFILAHFSDPDVGRYLLDDDAVTTRDQAQAIIDFYLAPEARSYNRWVIEHAPDQRPIGTCGFHKWDRRFRKAEIGYDLSPAAWGQGYMSEALRRALAYGFGEMALNRVEAVVHPDNAASLTLLDRLGFAREGLLREVVCRDGVFYDHWLLSLLRRDWA